MLKSGSNILEVLDLLQQYGPAPLTQWFEQGLQEYLTDGEKTLDICLGLRGQSERSWRYQFLMMQRNNHLREAHTLCDGDTPWKKSCELAKQIDRFRGIIWPRFKDLEDVPEGTSALRTTLFNTFKVGLPVPKTTRQLHDIVDLNL